MRKRVFLLLILLLFEFNPFAWALSPTTSQSASHKTLQTLKQTMGHFSNLMTGIEVLRIKEKKANWETLETTLNEMSASLSIMQESDTTHAYKAYTDVLAQSLDDLKIKIDKKDPQIYVGFEKLMHHCFGCHAAHRTSDYLIRIERDQKPKKNQPLY